MRHNAPLQPTLRAVASNDPIFETLEPMATLQRVAHVTPRHSKSHIDFGGLQRHAQARHNRVGTQLPDCSRPAQRTDRWLPHGMVNRRPRCQLPASQSSSWRGAFMGVSCDDMPLRERDHCREQLSELGHTMTWTIAPTCAALTAGIVEAAQHQSYVMSGRGPHSTHSQAEAKAQPDLAKRESAEFEFGFVGWLT
jgi:hypothetical protein